MLPENFILLDTEYTAWEGSYQRDWSGENEYREMIQIGSVKVGPDPQECGAQKVYVRPVKNPILSDYITSLTGVTQADVDRAGTLPEAFREVVDFCGDSPIYSWGRDGRFLKENFDLLGIEMPVPVERFLDIRTHLAPALENKGMSMTGYTSGTMIEAFGETGGEAHDAVNDMRNLLRVLQILRSESLL